jgi:D-alanine transfer protein
MCLHFLYESAKKMEMTENNSKPQLPHLRALGVALLFFGLIVAIAVPIVRERERKTTPHLVAEPFSQKNQGRILQRAGFSRPDVLMVYGSSELTQKVPTRASEFFRDAPTGFQVCPVGKAGNQSILIAQKLGSLGSTIKNRKVVIILSPTWFLKPGVKEDHYEGNFSHLQASSILFSKQLSRGLRMKLTKRMLEFDGSLEDLPILDAYFNCSLGSSKLSSMVKTTLRPFIYGKHGLLIAEDILATAFSAYTLKGSELPWQAKPSQPDWKALLEPYEKADAITYSESGDRSLKTVHLDHDADMIAEFKLSREWGDFQLLLETLEDLKAEALIIPIPMTGLYYDKHKFSREARDYYYQGIARMCAEHGMRVGDFSDHDRDAGFLIGTSTHPTAKAWLYINRLLDDFYHDRLPTPVKPKV